MSKENGEPMTIFSFSDGSRLAWSLSPAGLADNEPAVIDVCDDPVVGSPRYEYTESDDTEKVEFYRGLGDAIRRLVTP